MEAATADASIAATGRAVKHAAEKTAEGRRRVRRLEAFADVGGSPVEGATFW
jgi:hypothetical protein